MTDILMVCVRQDVARTKALAEMFLSAGFSIGDVQASDAALRSSAAAILVWSHASVQSASFRDASRRAIGAGKALIVNLISPSSRPTRIGCAPIFDLSRWAGDPSDAVLGPLRQAVAGMVKELRAQVEHWRTIRHSDEASAFVDYLARYGLDAPFSDAAEQRLDEIAFGALVGVRSPSAQLEPVTEDANPRGAPARRRMSAAAREEQINNDSAARRGEPSDESAAPTSPASKRRSRSPSSRGPTSSGNERERDAGVGRQRAAMPFEALWSPRSRPTGEREARAQSRIDDAPSASGYERLASVKQAVRAAAARLALDLRNLQRWAVARFDTLRVAGLASVLFKSEVAREPKIGVSSTSVRASVRAKISSLSRLVISWSAIERCIAHYLVVGKRIAQHPITIAPLVVGAALAGVLFWTGSASNMAGAETDIRIADDRTGEIVIFDESESADLAASQTAQESLAAAPRAARTRRATISPSESAIAASRISMSSNDASASAAPPQPPSRAPSDTEALISSESLTTETLAFDLAPHLPQSAERDPAMPFIGGTFRNASPIGAPALSGAPIGEGILADASQGSADLLLPAQERAYCPDTSRQVGSGPYEPPAQGRGGLNCAVR